MTQKITLFSQEVEDFVIEIKIDADATFYDLHKIIQKACNFEEQDNQRFMICNEDWKIERNILLKDNEDTGIDEDLYLMRETTLKEFLEEEGQRLAYLFDAEGKRFFMMELTENIFGHPQTEPIVSRRHGTAPQQTLIEEDVIPTETNNEIDENFYGDDGFEEDEIDLEGFEINE